MFIPLADALVMTAFIFHYDSYAPVFAGFVAVLVWWDILQQWWKGRG